MSVRARIMIVVVLAICLKSFIDLVKARKLELKYMLVWILCDLALILIIAFPNIIGVVTRFLGITTPMNAIFFLGFVFSLLIIFSLTMSVSHTTQKVRQLAQEIALTEEESRKRDIQEQNQDE